ncbi:MAG: hypothetical protein ACI9NY_001813 [Kiritimatiellia bacterium]|jgi:hypothetical protein
MEILLSLLIEWMSLNTDMSIEEIPNIVIMSPEALDKKYGKPVHALYEHQKSTIFLSHKIDLTTIQGASVLLHELVHHHQNMSGAMDDYNCIQESEKLAYEVQRQYLTANSAKLMPELDSFNIMMRSFCEDVP